MHGGSFFFQLFIISLSQGEELWALVDESVLKLYWKTAKNP